MSPHEGQAHRRLSLALIILATLLAFLAIFAVWANRQLLNTDNWTTTSEQLIENEAIRDQVGLFLADELYANVDVEGRLQQSLPPRLDPLAGPAAGGIKQLAERGTQRALARPRAQALWVEANRRAHRRLLQVVEGGGDVVSTEGGDVTLDLKAMLGQTAERVGVGGRLQQKLPADAAQIKIVRSDELELAQDAVDLLKTLAVVLVVLSLALFGLVVVLARGWRREALRACGFGLVVAGAGALVVRALAGNAVVDALADTESVRPAAEASWSIATSLLEEAAAATLGYGVVVVIAAWLAGNTHPAVATRGALAPFLAKRTHAYAILSVLVLLLLVWSPTPATRRVLPVLLLIALLVVGMEALRRQMVREHPDADAAEALQRGRERVRESFARTRHGGGDARLGELERLASLRDSGTIDGAEFKREKQRILGPQPPPEVADG